MVAHSAENHQGLSEHFVPWREISASEVATLEQLLGNNPDEAAMQNFIETYPHFLIQHLSTGQGHWVIPQKRLGSDYITDFMIAERDSEDLIWQAVELESPKAKIFIKSGDASATLNHAIRQINDWRDWLSRNRDYASRLKVNAGLNLTDVDPELQGLIIIGRDSQLGSETKDRKKRLQRSLHIRIETYDWLLRQVKLQHSTYNSARRATLGDWAEREKKRDSPNTVFQDTFEEYSNVSTQASATNFASWNIVTLDTNGDRYEICCEEVRQYNSEGEITLHDWDEWVENSQETYGILGTELEPDRYLKSTLVQHSEGVWHDTRRHQQGMPHFLRVDVLVHIPITMNREEKRQRAMIARILLEQEIPRAHQRSANFFGNTNTS